MAKSGNQKFCNRRCKDNFYRRNWDAEKRAAKAAYQAQYREANREKARLVAAEWRKNNPERHKQNCRDAYRANKVLFQRGRDKRRNRPGTPYSQAEWERICLRYGDACVYCGSTDRIEKDHIIPLARGGSDSIGNVVPACYDCNRSKHSKFVMEWKLRKIKRAALLAA